MKRILKNILKYASINLICVSTITYYEINKLHNKSIKK